MTTLEIRPVEAGDAEAIAGIYNHYIRETVITFEETVVSAEAIRERLESVQSAGLPWLVAERDSAVVGYAYATPWRARAAYRFSAEVSVYVAAGSGRQGIGAALYDPLFARLQELGLHAVIGGITLPNPASVAFHESRGMRKVAHFSEVGFKFGQWLDVGYWQLTLESSPRPDMGP